MNFKAGACPTPLRYYRNSSEGTDYIPVQLIRRACESLDGQRSLAAAAQASCRKSADCMDRL